MTATLLGILFLAGVLAAAISLLASSRSNVSIADTFPSANGRRFGIVVDSLGGSPAQLVVERAMYSSVGGVTWTAGTAAVATRLQ